MNFWNATQSVRISGSYQDFVGKFYIFGTPQAQRERVLLEPSGFESMARSKQLGRAGTECRLELLVLCLFCAICAVNGAGDLPVGLVAG